MESLRDKIEDLLIKENYTFSQLANYLELTEEQLDEGLKHKTLELRYLEDISKNLKVPLYSFFRNPVVHSNDPEKPFYVNKLWNDGEDPSPQKLMEEIDILKKVLAYKEQELVKSLK